MCVLNVYDVEFRYVAFQCPIPSLSCKMFVFNEEVCTVSADGIMYRIVESALNTKLNGLVEKSLFDVAIG